jgi:hypothetical protein
VSDVARLWRRVEEMEPVCRNRHAQRVNDRHSRRASLGSIVPVEEIMMAREA